MTAEQAPDSSAIRTAQSRIRLLMTCLGLLSYALGVGIAHTGTAALVIRLGALVILLGATLSRRTLTAWTFFAILAGAELGADLPAAAVHLHVVAEIFLRLVRVIVAPLILGTLTTGIAGHAQLKSLGRVAFKTLVYFELVTTLALVIGALAINISRAGEGVIVPAALMQQEALPASGAASHAGLESFLLNVFPENLVSAVGQNQILQVAVFAILLGVSLALLSEEKRAPLLSLLNSLTAAMFQFTRIIMYLAPFAAGAALSYTVGSMGIATLVPLAKLLATFYGAALTLGAAGLCAGAAADAHPAARLPESSKRTCGDRLCHQHLRERAAPRNGAHGRVRRAPLGRIFRNPVRLQLQHGWGKPVSLDRSHLCRAGRRHSSHAMAAGGDAC